MEHPEYIYWAAVCLIAWPASLFSRCAGILAGTWAIGQVAYVFGAPEPETQIFLYCGASIFGILGARTKACITVAIMYMPLAMMEAWSVVQPLEMWWSIFVTAMLQILFVPFTVDWAEISEVRKAFRERRNWDKTLYRLKMLTCW